MGEFVASAGRADPSVARRPRDDKVNVIIARCESSSPGARPQTGPRPGSRRNLPPSASRARRPARRTGVAHAGARRPRRRPNRPQAPDLCSNPCSSEVAMPFAPPTAALSRLKSMLRKEPMEVVVATTRRLSRRRSLLPLCLDKVHFKVRYP